MGQVTYLKDILEKTKEDLKDEFEPWVIDEVWEAHIKQIEEAVKNPNMYRIRLPENFGSLCSNIYLNNVEKTSKTCKERYEFMKGLGEEDKKFKGFSRPYIAQMVYKLFGLKEYFLNWKIRKEYLLNVANETNKFYNKQNKGYS